MTVVSIAWRSSINEVVLDHTVLVLRYLYSSPVLLFFYILSKISCSCDFLFYASLTTRRSLLVVRPWPWTSPNVPTPREFFLQRRLAISMSDRFLRTDLMTVVPSCNVLNLGEGSVSKTESTKCRFHGDGAMSEAVEDSFLQNWPKKRRCSTWAPEITVCQFAEARLCGE